MAPFKFIGLFMGLANFQNIFYKDQKYIIYNLTRGTIRGVPCNAGQCFVLKGLIGFFIYPILRQQYWTFLYCSPFSYRSSNFAIAKWSLLIPQLKFLYKFCRLVHGFFSVLLPIQLSLFQLLRQHQCRSFTLLEALAKSQSTHIAIAFKSEKEQ